MYMREGGEGDREKGEGLEKEEEREWMGGGQEHRVVMDICMYMCIQLQKYM